MPCTLAGVTSPRSYLRVQKKLTVFLFKSIFFWQGDGYIPVPSKLRNASCPGKRQSEGKEASFISKLG